MAKVTAKNVLTFGAELFSWKGREGIAEASTLQGGNINFLPWRQLWVDSCDIGFFLKSPKTGAQVLFVFVGQELEFPDHPNEGGWFYKFEEYQAETKSNPLKLVIFND